MTRNLFCFCSIIALAVACEKADVEGVQNLNQDKISVIGHGGMGVGSAYPLDSFESLNKARLSGADGVEMDVQMTRDSVLVAFHDPTLDKRTACSGMVNELTWEELRTCRYNEQPYSQFHIAALWDMFGQWSDIREKQLVFDCKLHTPNESPLYYVGYVSRLIALIEEFQIGDNVLIESQNMEFLGLIRTQKPEYKCFIYPDSYEEGLVQAASLGMYGITIAADMITAEQVGEAHRLGLRVAVWNVHSRTENVQAINKSPDYIQTDRLKSLLRLLD